MDLKKIFIFGVLLWIDLQASPVNRKLSLSGWDGGEIIQPTEENNEDLDMQLGDDWQKESKELQHYLDFPDNLYEQHEAVNEQESRADFAGFSLAWNEEINFIYVKTQAEKNSEEKRAFLDYGLKNDNFATMVIDNDQKKFWVKLKDDEKLRAKTYALYLVNMDARYKRFSLKCGGVDGGAIFVYSKFVSNKEEKRAFLDYMLEGNKFENMSIGQTQKQLLCKLRDDEQERKKIYTCYPLKPVVKDAMYKDMFLRKNGRAICVYSRPASNSKQKRAFLDYMLEGNKFENMRIKQPQKILWRILSDNEQEREKTYRLYDAEK